MPKYLYSLDGGTLESDGDGDGDGDGGYLLIICILTYHSDTVGYDNSG